MIHIVRRGLARLSRSEHSPRGPCRDISLYL
jgi:hypothetical protein